MTVVTPLVWCWCCVDAPLTCLDLPIGPHHCRGAVLKVPTVSPPPPCCGSDVANVQSLSTPPPCTAPPCMPQRCHAARRHAARCHTARRHAATLLRLAMHPLLRHLLCHRSIGAMEPLLTQPQMLAPLETPSLKTPLCHNAAALQRFATGAVLSRCRHGSPPRMQQKLDITTAADIPADDATTDDTLLMVPSLLETDAAAAVAAADANQHR